MTNTQNESFERLLRILENISTNLEPISLLKNWDFWGILVSLASVIVLAITLRYLIKYTRATEKIAEYQLMPTIDVKMIHNPNASPPSTYFWFSNESNSPGWVYLSWTYLNKDTGQATDGQHSRLRIAPNEKGIKTTDSFFQNPNPGDEIRLNVLIKSAFKKLGNEELKIGIEFEKTYNFDGDKNSWNNTSWSYPVDRPFPFPQRIKKCSECKSEIDFEAKKCRYCLSTILERGNKSDES